MKIGHLDVAEFMDTFRFCIYNWFGVFLLMALAVVMMGTGKRSGIRERMVWGIVHGTVSGIWFVVDCVPWANLVAAQLWVRKTRGLDTAEKKYTEYMDNAQSHAALAERQAAVLGSILFVAASLALLFIGIRALTGRSRYGKGSAAVGTVNLIMALGYLICAVLCICRSVSDAGKI